VKWLIIALVVTPKEKYVLKATGWGLLYGALAASVIVGSIMAWFYFYYFEKY